MKIIHPSLAQLVEFEQVSWPRGLRATKRTLNERLNEYREGVFALVKRGKLVAQVTVAPKRIPKEVKSFKQMRDALVYEKSHNLWVLNIATRPDERGKGYASKVMKRVISWARKKGYWTIQTGVTCHNYAHYLRCGKVSSIEDYLAKGLNPALNIFGSNTRRKIIPNYWPEDKGSGGYGVLLKLSLR